MAFHLAVHGNTNDPRNRLLDSAIASHRAGEVKEAARHYRKLLKLWPRDIESRHLFAILRFQQGRHDEAIDLIRSALRVKPDYPEALYNLGNIYSELKRYREAIESYDRALAINPLLADAEANRGNALLELKQYENALASFDRALAMGPASAGTLNNRGTALKMLKRYGEALDSYDRALAINPDFVGVLVSKAAVFAEIKRSDLAADACEQAISFEPDNREAWRGLADAALNLCDWKRHADVSARLERHISSASPFTLLNYRDDPKLQRLCAESFSNERLPVMPPPISKRFSARAGRIKIAYISHDFRNKPLPYLMAELFETHDRSRFEVIAISDGHDDGSEIRKRLIAAFDQFHDVQDKPDRDVAKLIHDLNVDIAVDLMGYTQGGRPEILAYRPAPVQASYLGYPGTLGAKFIDYIIVDPVIAPFEHEPFYSEKIMQLPECYLVRDRKRRISEITPTRQEMQLPENGFVFCCFNSIHKITPPFFDVWMRLLGAVAGSVLWLMGGSEAANANIIREAQERQIDPGRIVFAKKISPQHHLARHRLADLFLDTLPYNAHTTASDALWMGLPLLTCEGKSFPARVASSLLQTLGLPELVTRNLAEYEALALRLATEPESLSAIREKLAHSRGTSPAFDTDRFRTHLEAGYLEMWETFQRGEAPRSFRVAPRDSLLAEARDAYA